MFGSGKDFPRCVPGKPVRAEPFNRAFGVLEQLTRMYFDPPLEAVDIGGRVCVRLGGGEPTRIVKVGSGGISGRVGATLGQGTAKLQKNTFLKSGTSTAGTLADDTDATVYNQWLGWISANSYATVVRREGQWFISAPEPIHIAVLTTTLATGTLASPSSANATLYRGSGSGVHVTTTTTILVYNTMVLTASVPSGKQIHISEKGGVWHAHTREC